MNFMLKNPQGVFRYAFHFIPLTSEISVYYPITLYRWSPASKITQKMKINKNSNRTTCRHAQCSCLVFISHQETSFFSITFAKEIKNTSIHYIQYENFIIQLKKLYFLSSKREMINECLKWTYILCYLRRNQQYYWENNNCTIELRARKQQYCKLQSELLLFVYLVSWKRASKLFVKNLLLLLLINCNCIICVHVSCFNEKSS